MKKVKLFLSALFLCLILVSCPAMALTLMEVYNENDQWTDGTWYATQVALKYVPVSSYDLGRVEFFTGGAKSNVTIALRPDAGDYPSTTILTSGTYDSSGSGIWQGATFSSPYSVLAGTPYWVTWYFTVGLESPYSDGN